MNLKQLSTEKKEDNEKREQNFGLSQAEFESLRGRLQNGDDALVKEHISKRFEQLVQHLRSKFSIDKEVAWDCAVDALYGLLEELKNGKHQHGNLEAFLKQRIEWTYKDSLKSAKERFNRRIDSINDYGDTFYQDTKEEVVLKELRLEVANAIQKLCKNCRIILKESFFYEKSHQEIAKVLGKKANNIGVQKFNCLKKLRVYISESFYREFLSLLETTKK